MLFLQGLVGQTEPAGLPLLLLAGPQPDGRDVVGAVREAVVDSFVVYSLPEDHPQVNAALERRVPVVVVDEPRLPGRSFVGVDDRNGARQAAEHLVELGHRRFGIISLRVIDDDHPGGRLDPERYAGGTYSITKERIEGYREGLEAAGIDFGAVPIEECPASSAAVGAIAARALLAEDPRPTAILASSDLLAFGVMGVARELGIDVPGDALGRGLRRRSRGRLLGAAAHDRAPAARGEGRGRRPRRSRAPGGPHRARAADRARRPPVQRTRRPPREPAPGPCRCTARGTSAARRRPCRSSPGR